MFTKKPQPLVISCLKEGLNLIFGHYPGVVFNTSQWPVHICHPKGNSEIEFINMRLHAKGTSLISTEWCARQWDSFPLRFNGGNFKFEETKIVEREKNSLKRKILESIHISNKIDSFVNLKLGMKLNPVWSPIIKDLKLSWVCQADSLLYLHTCARISVGCSHSQSFLSCVFKIMGWKRHSAETYPTSLINT